LAQNQTMSPSARTKKDEVYGGASRGGESKSMHFRISA